MSGEMCKDNFCNSKFVHSIQDGCCIGQIELTITINQRILTYTVTNTGTMNLCNDILICSKLFGKTRIDNKYLSYKDSVSVTKNMNDIKFPMVIEYEKAAAFTCHKEGLYLASHEFCISFQNGDVPPNPNPAGFAILDHDLYSEPTLTSTKSVTVSIYNSPYSTMDLENVEFIIPFNTVFSETSLIDTDSTNRVTSLEVVPDGLLVKADRIPIRSGISIVFRFDTALPEVTLPISFKINTSTPVIEYTNWFNKSIDIIT